MNRCSIFDFNNALNMPYSTLATLKDISADMATLTRSKYFAECHISGNMGRAILYAPIDDYSLHMAHNAHAALQDAYKCGFVEINFLHNELLRINRCRLQREEGSRCTLIMEPLPDGTPLEVAVNSMDRTMLIKGLEHLDACMQRCDISHNNLSLRNIIIDKSYRWLPIRQYYTTRGYGNDKDSMERLRELIIKYTTPTPEVDMSSVAPWYVEPLHPIDAIYEGRRMVTTERGVGFEDEHGNMVIEDKYLYASDFMENRAMVTTQCNKMGVIDRYGREIIPAIYDSVRYSVDSGKSIVVCGDLCAVFDYEGRQTSGWISCDRITEL